MPNGIAMKTEPCSTPALAIAAILVAARAAGGTGGSRSLLWCYRKVTTAIGSSNDVGYSVAVQSEERP